MRFLSFITVALALPSAPAQTMPVEGNPASPVRVIIYEDLQCPDCAVFREMLDKTLLPRFAGKVAFEHRDFPLAKHAWARKEATVARFFATISPETGIEFRRAMLAHISQIKSGEFTQYVTTFAREHGVDPEKALASLDDAKLAAAVQADLDEGVARGIAHTPTVLVNGEPFIESFPVEDVAKSIERALGQ